MTEKLFEQDAYIKEFSAQVCTCEASPKGYAVILDRTAFYPEGGGQPCDCGTLGDAVVTEVHYVNGEIVHTCDRPVSGTVTGIIDRERRFDLMQQHSGEHIVSGLIHNRFGYENVGFHMGADMITIDLSGMLTMQEVAEIELAANRVIWDNIPVDIFYPSAEELQALAYRSKKELLGQVRIVRWPGVDTCACCGTHVARSGEIGLIKLLSCVKFRDGVRIELLCGKRAYDYVSAVVTQNREISGLLSAKPLETAQAAGRMAQELADTKFALTGAQQKYFESLAESFRDLGDVFFFEDGLSPDALRRLGVEVMEVCGGRCAVFSGTDEEGYKYAVGEKDGDLREFVKEMNTALRGRGGGKPFFAQGSVTASKKEICEYFNM